MVCNEVIFTVIMLNNSMVHYRGRGGWRKVGVNDGIPDKTFGVKRSMWTAYISSNLNATMCKM